VWPIHAVLPRGQNLSCRTGRPCRVPHNLYKPRYNIAPTDPHWIVRSRFEDREVLPAKWGLVNFWMADRKQAFKSINARA